MKRTELEDSIRNLCDTYHAVSGAKVHKAGDEVINYLINVVGEWFDENYHKDEVKSVVSSSDTHTFTRN